MKVIATALTIVGAFLAAVAYRGMLIMFGAALVAETLGIGAPIGFFDASLLGFLAGLLLGSFRGAVGEFVQALTE